MTSRDRWDALFPRHIPGRIGLGLASLFLAPFSGFMLFLLLFKAAKPRDAFDWIL